MRAGWASVIAVLSTMGLSDARAQGTYNWSDIDCAQSRLVATSGAKCRGTNVVSGGVTADGQFQRWSIVGSQPYSHVYLHESLNSNSYITTRETTVDFLKWMNQRAKSASDMTGPNKHGGADYYLFKTKDGEDCAGFRRFGPSRSVGYAWVMGGIICSPKGTALAPAQITAFIDGALVK
jgi:hypothetical protein